MPRLARDSAMFAVVVDFPSFSATLVIAFCIFELCRHLLVAFSEHKAGFRVGYEKRSLISLKESLCRMVLFLVNHSTEEYGVNLVSEVFLVLYGVACYRYRNNSRK